MTVLGFVSLPVVLSIVAVGIIGLRGGFEATGRVQRRIEWVGSWMDGLGTSAPATAVLTILSSTLRTCIHILFIELFIVAAIMIAIASRSLVLKTSESRNLKWKVWPDPSRTNQWSLVYILRRQSHGVMTRTGCALFLVRAENISWNSCLFWQGLWDTVN